jgi:hypothetical protein
MAVRNADGSMRSDAVETHREAPPDAWSTWAAELTRRVDLLEMRTTIWLGSPDEAEASAEKTGVEQLLYAALDSERGARAEALAKLADCLTERLSAEISVLDERFAQRLDAKVFDLASLRAFRQSLEKANGERESEMREDIIGKLKDISERVDNVDRGRRYDRNTQHKEGADAMMKVLALFEVRAGQIDKRVDDVISELRILRALLVDSEQITPEEWPIRALAAPRPAQ